MLAIPLLSTLLALSSLSAIDYCRGETASLNSRSCEQKYFEETDRDLNIKYKRVIRTLRPDEKKWLVLAQRAWVPYRENNCRFEGILNGDKELVYRKEYYSCMADMTRDRVLFLTRVLNRP